MSQNPTTDLTVSRAEIRGLAEAALQRAGASRAVTDVLVDATLSAEDHGMRGVGVAHLLDFVDAAIVGRLNAAATPDISQLAPAVFSCEAHGGPFHLGFVEAEEDLAAAARSQGVAVFVQSGAFAGGQLGWFTERLSVRGLVGLGAINSNAYLATAPGTGRVLGTNPLSYSFPRGDGQVLTVDQASSAAAYVNVRTAADNGEPIPEGWAVDAAGNPTTDASAAVVGAMLPFGGYKGANIAWLVELLAGLSGGNWSIDAPPFNSGTESPGVGMFLLAIDVNRFPGDAVARADGHISRLAGLGVRTPGTARSEPLPEIRVSAAVLEELRVRAGHRDAHGI